MHILEKGYISWRQSDIDKIFAIHTIRCYCNTQICKYTILSYKCSSSLR